MSGTKAGQEHLLLYECLRPSRHDESLLCPSITSLGTVIPIDFEQPEFH